MSTITLTRVVFMPENCELWLCQRCLDEIPDYFVAEERPRIDHDTTMESPYCLNCVEGRQLRK